MRAFLIVFCTSLLLSVHVSVAAQDSPDPNTIETLAKRCGMDVDWCRSFEDASERAQKEDKPIVVLVHKLSGFNVQNPGLIGPFMNQDVIELVRERFVPLLFALGSKAPFVEPDVYGIGPLAFGTTILVTDKEGQIKGDTFVMEPSAVYQFLVKSAEPWQQSPSPSLESSEDLAQWHLTQGNLAEAEFLLRSLKSPHSLYLLSQCLRKQRRGQEALDALHSAREVGFEKSTVWEEAQLLTLLNKPHEALEILDGIADAKALPSTLHLKASCLIAIGDAQQGIICLKRLVNEFPESSESWQAAAYLTHEVLLAETKGGRIGLSDPEVYEVLTIPPSEPFNISEIDEVMEAARVYLMDAQREDGSWIHPGEVQGFMDRRVHPLVIATTALAARALIPFAEDPKVASSLEKAIAFLATCRSLLAVYGNPKSIMDYSVWSEPCLILFLVEALEVELLEEEVWGPYIETLITQLSDKQKSGGGWSYYQGGDPQKLDPNLDISFSFVTAFVLLSMSAADHAGYAPPEEMTSSAIECLKKMRNSDGTFEYSIVHANEGAPRFPLPEGNAGRGPLCELALHSWGESSVERIQGALQIFVNCRASYANEQGKSLMHCGQQGQGSHYLLFDYAYALDACRTLDDDSQEELSEPILELFSGARSEGGSFHDNPVLGAHYGTAMALWSVYKLSSEE